MELGLQGRVAVITGGSKGIGLACAHALAREGARLAIVARTRADLTAAADGLRLTEASVLVHACDLTDAEATSAMFAEVESALGPVDVLVNCAGAARRYLPSELNVDAYRQAMDAKYFSYVNAMEGIIHRMAARRRGAIVNVIGASGKVASGLHIPAGAANAALMLTTVALASEYAQHGLRINGINPGVTMTGRVEKRLHLAAKQAGTTIQEELRKMLAAIPLGRAAHPDEIARVVTFLASDAASYVTGAIVPMDGGATAVI